MDESLPETPRRDFGGQDRRTEAGARCRPRRRANAEELLIDVTGLCVAARNTDYIRRARGQRR